MKKFNLCLALLLFILISSSFKGRNMQESEALLSVQADSSVYGVSYSYDAAGNRISRSPNTVILSSYSLTKKKVSLQDSLRSELFTTDIQSETDHSPYILKDKY